MTDAKSGSGKPLVVAPWKGGKARLAARLIPLFPAHRCYVEPFGGMASVLLNKPKSETEVYNDRDERLVGLFNTIKFHPDALDQEMAWLLKSRQTFDTYRAQPGVTDIQRAARFLYRQSLGFAGKGETFGTAIKGGGTTLRTAEALRQVAVRIRERFASVTVEWLDWEQCIEKYDSADTFFYCDPPYHDTEGYRPEFLERDREALAVALRRLRGKFLLHDSDDQITRQLYRGFHLRTMKTALCLGATAGGSTAGGLKHLTVTNYPVVDPR